MIDLARKSDVARILKNFETPVYVYWEKSILERMDRLRCAFLSQVPLCEVAYSLKACFCPAIVQIMIRGGLRLECSSPGEIYVALKSGADPARIIYNGIAKQWKDVAFAIAENVGVLSIDSGSDMRRIYAVAKDAGKRVDVLLRVNPGLEMEDELGGGTLVTASRQSKFGVPLHGNDEAGDSAEALLLELLETSHDYLNLRGLHFHVGTQLSSPLPFVNAITSVTELWAEIQKRHGSELPLQYLDIGGGFPPETAMPISTWPPAIGQALNRARFLGRLIVEPGRYLVADGVLVATVSNIKRDPVLGTIVISDVGYHNLLDAALLGQCYPVEVLEASQSADISEVHLAGPLCDPIDSFTRLGSRCYNCGQKFPDAGKRIRLPHLAEGDHLMFGQAGAYSTVLNTQFNGFPLPAIVLVRSDGRLDVVRRRGSLESFFVREGGEFLE